VDRVEAADVNDDEPIRTDTDDAEYRLAVEVPSIEEYLRLRVAAGLSPKSAAAAAAGLPNSVFAVLVRHAAQVVGMGRLIGDGGLFFQVVDIAVEPAHQGRGLGSLIVGRIVEYVHQHAPPGAYVSLLADDGADRLYARFGFALTAPRSVGMALRLPDVTPA
jgi:GNAT superfamily N-acetyltransferase